MPGSRRLSVASVLTATPALLVFTAPKAAAEPGDSPCDLIRGPAKQYCEQNGEDSGGSNGGGSPEPSDALDPVAALSKRFAEAASWLIRKLSDLVESTTTVDFTNAAFLRQYAVVFAASTILTLVIWLLAVTKRAIRGVPLTQAIGEAVGFLWLTVIASAFTPLILYTVVAATDAVTKAIASGTGGETDSFFGTFAEALEKGNNIGGGPIMLIVVSLISIIAAGVLYLELVIRAALLYVGALLGTAVYAGLVDKNLWGHVRRWAGLMIAVILVKPVIMIVLGLAGALNGDEEGPGAFSAVVSGLAIILLAIFASAMIYRFVPGFGDDIQAHRSASQSAARGATAAVSSPAALVSAGIKTHSARGGGGESSPARSSGGGNSRPSNPVSGGVAAHSGRNSDPNRRPPQPRPAERTGASRGRGERR
ncbi:hypothetical protein [Streptomyces sp. NPDC005438]|uniref:hypothetical protein n=1 Tax=Streptomyces sp. NPDC005438 TaxID=3156880 RepID=UPI0033A16F7D